MTKSFAQWQRGDPGFNDRVHGPSYNKLPIDRLPDVLVAPRCEEDLAHMVRSARKNGHKVAVRSSGHSWIGASLREGGVLVDMGHFDRLEIDVATRTAKVGAAVRSDDLGKALARVGLAFPIGHCGGPAMGGYLLAGGLGLNWGAWKPACFSVRSIRVVTASGEIVVASETSNSDLLWMARGGGPGFPGVVTEFELDLQDLPLDVRVSSWFFPLDALAEVTRWVCEASKQLPLNVELATMTIGPDRAVLPPGEGYPSHLVSVSAVAYVDNEHQAVEALSALAAGPRAEPLLKTELVAVPFEQLYLGADASHPEGQRVLADTFWTDSNVHAALPQLSETMRAAPAGKSFVVAIMPGHGAPSAGVPTGVAAYSMDERTLMLAFAVWDDPAHDAANHQWMTELVRKIEPLSTGHFLGEADLTRDVVRAAQSFSPSNWQRLLELRAQWDPGGVFHGFPQAQADRQ